MSLIPSLSNFLRAPKITDDVWNEHLARLLELGITQLWCPLPKQTLQYIFRDPAIERALQPKQKRLLGDFKINFAKLHKYGHISCEDGDESIQSERILGEGGFAIVDQVSIPTSPLPTICVRKKIGRVRQFKAQKQLIDAFTREIHVMRQVKHRHCVQILGSYTDYDCLAILLLPVADMDLAAYLNLPLDDDQFGVVRRGMGCLCTALAYLHEKKIRYVLIPSISSQVRQDDPP